MRLKRFLAGLLAAVMVMPMFAIDTKAATGDIYINGYFFAGLREVIQEDKNINPDGDGVLTQAEREAVTKIDLDLSAMTERCFSTDGFNVFPNLVELQLINSTTISCLDIRGCTSLKKLVVYNNSFTTIMCDKSNPNLEHIDLSSNAKLTSFYSGAFQNLKYLNLAGSGVTSFNVIDNPYLKDAYVNNTRAFQSPYMIYEHNGNQLIVNSTNIIVSGLGSDDILINYVNFPNSTMFDRVCTYDKNKDFVLSLEERNQPVSMVFANGCGNFKGIEYFNNIYGFGTNGEVKDLDYTVYRDLTILRLYNSKLSMIDLSYYPKLENLALTGNPLTKIDVSLVPNLTKLELNRTSLKTLDISSNPNLYFLDISNTDITVIDISNNPILLEMYNSSTRTEKTINNYIEYKGKYVKDTDCVTLRVPVGAQIITEKQEPIPTPTPETTPGVTPTTTPTPTPSTNDVTAFVDRLYYEVLGRTPDSASKGWVDVLKNRQSDGLGVALGFFNSLEFTSKNKSDEDFVKICYKTFFNRTASQKEIDRWVAALKGGATREQVVRGFGNSREWVILCWQFGINSGAAGIPDTTGVKYDKQTVYCMEFVDKLYSNVLGRAGDPAGVVGWALPLKKNEVSGAKVAYGFFFSPEFTMRNTTNTEYVTTLYNVFLGRNPDAAGLNAWVEALDKGATRQKVFDGFTYSTEWANLCKGYGIIPV